VSAVPTKQATVLFRDKNWNARKERKEEEVCVCVCVCELTVVDVCVPFDWKGKKNPHGRVGLLAPRSVVSRTDARTDTGIPAL
jgi:hypothetical protein